MVNDEQSSEAPQQEWCSSVRAFRWAADCLTNPVAQLVADFSEAEALPDLTPDVPMVDFSPFQALSDTSDRHQSDPVESSDRPSRLTFPQLPKHLNEQSSRPFTEPSVARSPQFPIQSPRSSPLSSTAPLLKANTDTRSPLFSFKQRHPAPHSPNSDEGGDRVQQRISAGEQLFHEAQSSGLSHDVSTRSHSSDASMQSTSPLEQSIDLLNTLADGLLATPKSSKDTDLSDRSGQSNSPAWETQAQQISWKETQSHNLSALDTSLMSNHGMHQSQSAIASIKSLTTDLETTLKQSLTSTSENLSNTAKTTESVGWVEPLRNPTPLSSILQDTTVSQPTVLSISDAEQLAALVNDALIEQAQRHGVDLS